MENKNKTLLESSMYHEFYYNPDKILEQLGPIQDILNNEYILNEIIAAKDCNLTYAFFNKVNEGIKKGIVKDEELEFFRNGTLIDAIINLEEITRSYGRRRLNKINYISLIEDQKTLSVSYTHPEIIDTLCGKRSYAPNSKELTDFVECGLYNNLPKEVKIAIISEILKRGNLEVAKKLSENDAQMAIIYELLKGGNIEEAQSLLESAIDSNMIYPTNNYNYTR